MPDSPNAPRWLTQAQFAALGGFLVVLPLSQSLTNICYVLSLLLWIGRKIIERRWSLAKTPLNPFLLGWLLVAMASFVNTVDVGASLNGIRKIVKYLLLYVMIVETIDSPARLRTFLWCSVAGLAVLGLDGLWQITFGRDLLYGRPPHVQWETVRRATATFHHPNDLAIPLASFVPVAMSIAILGRGRWRRAAMCAAVMASAALVLTFSRGGSLAFLVSLLCLSVWLRRWLPVVIATAALAVQVLIVPPSVKQWASEQTTFVDQLTAPDRLLHWYAAARMAQAHPVVGVGTNTFVKNYARYMAPEDTYGERPPYAHNMYLHLAAELGLLGLALFVLILVTLVRMAQTTRAPPSVRSPPPIVSDGGRSPERSAIAFRRRVAGASWAAIGRYGMGAGLVAYLVNGIFESSLFYSRASMLFWVLVGSLVAAIMIEQRPEASEASSGHGR